MAEFKLGRIRFIWKNNWAASTVYYKDDIVRNGGNIYLCVAGHTSTDDFPTDLQVYWNLLSEGQSWKGSWTTGIYYKVNDVVTYGAKLYIANTAHTSSESTVDGLEIDQSKWDLYTEGFVWKNNWAIAVRYVPNDIVKYNGITYICIEGHLSTSILADGLEADIDKWQVFNSGIYWSEDWQINYRYKINDLVKYGGYLYICNEGHTSAATESDGLELDQSKWDIFYKGIEYKNTWAADFRYKINDVVKYGGGLWICITQHTSQSLFTTDEDKWNQFVEGLEFEDSWNPTAYYQPGDVVTYGGYTYVAITNNIALKPSDNLTDWDLYNTGFKFIGDYDDDSTAREYIEGDVIRLGGYTYLCILKHTGQRPPNPTYWERLNSGIEWNDAWTDSAYYDAGDAIRYNNFTYICILAHTADETTAKNRPDQTAPTETGEDHWRLLSGGPENSVLTTDGDLLYYSQAGPARLAIGLPGQTLTVNQAGTEPLWQFTGSINHIYYVAPNGNDTAYPIAGSNLDKPWKTVRYAAEQVDKGPLRPAAQHLIKLNRAFLQEEVVEWVNYQIANAVAGSIWDGFTNSNIGLCRRDIGLIIDALVYDLGHGGNKSIRQATLTYFDSNNALIAAIADEDEQLVASLVYLEEVINAVISNNAPNTVYSSVNQNTDADYVQETDATSTITYILDIIRDTITSQSSINLPREYIPNNTIFVKTGTFNEILPIIVPERTAVVGDELRSTRIEPAGSFLHTTDNIIENAIATELSNTVRDVITNTAVTPITGNAITQHTTGVAGSAGSLIPRDSIRTLADEMLDIIENGIGNADALVFTDPGLDTNRLYARQLLQLNRALIISELTTWINDQISGNIAPFTSGFTYDQTKCERDTGYIVDGLSYDVQYQSNWATSINARAYFEGVISVIGNPDQIDETVAAYTQLGVIVESIVQGTYSGQNTNGGNVSSAAIGIEVNNLVQIVESVLSAGTVSALPTLNYPSITWTTTEKQDAVAAIIADKTNIQTHTVSYVDREEGNFNFNKVTCYRDAGYIVDALAYDMALGTNYQSVISGISYYRATTSAQEVINNQLTPTLNSIKFIKEKVSHIAISGPAYKAVNLLAKITEYKNTFIDNNGTEPITTGSLDPLSDTNHTYATEPLELNREFIKEQIVAKIDTTFWSEVTATTSGTNVFTHNNNYVWVENMAIKFSNTQTGQSTGAILSQGSIIEGQIYFIKQIVSSTEFTISATRDGAEIVITDDTGSMFVKYAYNENKCKRDLDTYIDAIKYDLIYTGNYKSLLAARYFVNAVTGSKLHDMFYLRNGTGLRNCTVAGLDGRSDGNDINLQIDGLGPANTYGTRRPLAGAFTSLDPGWGPDDSRTWIIARSPYVQNVTTFGDAAIGCKIDGSLHTGGNDSIVSNDFTQVISDGIGVWCTNLGRTELVSVFSYYNHIGYLAENGGKIRATNGNSSYGDFGTVAEGSDVTETPITGTVTNRAFEALVDSVFTDQDQILVFQYRNAGVNYTALGTTITVTGEGFGHQIDQVQTVDGAVFEVRILDTNDSSGEFGGDGYITATNAAQTGNTTQITIANTDTRDSSQYIGMAIFITAGTGAGQYGYIDTYNSGTKVATVKKMSDNSSGWDHLVPGTSIAGTLDGSTTYIIEPRISFTAPGSGLYADTTKARSVVEDGSIVKILIWDPGSGYVAAPTMTIVDPNNIYDGDYDVRIGDGVLTQPTWLNRGLGYATAEAEVDGDGYADIYQPGQFVRVENLNAEPKAGSNIEFSHTPGVFYKLVVVRNLAGTGPYTAQLQISPDISITDAPDHGTNLDITLRYSQVRLTGHDFLEIGTGNFTETNYPNLPLYSPDADKERVAYGGGRVFYTSTDQDGNFRVGELFSVEQATGVATLNADAFNISGLNELSLGELGLGGTGAVITEFSVDGTFTADSDNIVPTQKAIKTFITSQIGGGAAELNVNSITAGKILITTNEISTTTGEAIVVKTKVNFEKGVDGSPLALNYYLTA